MLSCGVWRRGRPRIHCPRFGPFCLPQRSFYGDDLAYRPGPQRKWPSTEAAGRSQGACPKPEDCACVSDSKALLRHHQQKPWQSAEYRQRAVGQHNIMSWGHHNQAEKLLEIESGRGIYLYDSSGKRYLDWNAGMMCANLGHGNPDLADAVARQMREVAFVAGTSSYTPTRAKLSSLLADLLPGDLDTFFFSTAGTEAVEAAVQMARQITGKYKIIARHRSYHGGSGVGASLSGDPRKNLQAGSPGIVHTMGPYPWTFSLGQDQEEVARNALFYMEETILQEGPEHIAAIITEAVTGTNGVLAAPKGYLEGLRELCDQYNILLICDEVMGGFGRTGKWFAFCHSDGVVPDMVTMAKGLTAGQLPLSAVAVRGSLAKHFEREALGMGSTYNAHPTSLACAYATLTYMLDKGVLEHVQEVSNPFSKMMKRLYWTHRSVKHARSIGLFGMIDLQKDSRGGFASDFNAPQSELMTEVAKHLRAAGMLAYIRWSSIMCCPPLIITEHGISEAEAILDGALAVADKYYEENCEPE